jgi:hypothetical protein
MNEVLDRLRSGEGTLTDPRKIVLGHLIAAAGDLEHLGNLDDVLELGIATQATKSGNFYGVTLFGLWYQQAVMESGTEN